MRLLLAGLLLAAAPSGLWAAEKLPGARAPSLAGSFVRSKEWVIRRKPEKIEEFIGDVRYWTTGRMARADWARFRHADRTWQLRGNILLQYSLPGEDGVIQAEGHHGRYDQNKELGSLRGKDGGKIEFKRTSKEDGDHFGTAGLFEWKMGKSASLSGGVHVWGPVFESWSDRMEFDWEDDVILLNGGRPVLRYSAPAWTGAFQGESIAAEQGREGGADILSAEKRVRGWIRFKVKPKP